MTSDVAADPAASEGRAGRAIPTALAFSLVIWLGALLAVRVPFRCDLYAWAESPFMTNMLKLASGQPLYGPGTDLDSVIYPPGLPWLTFALLAPFGAALDVRWCRVVSIALGVGAAAVTAAVATSVARELRPGLRRGGFFVRGLAVATLVVFASFTSEIPHPDNLHMLHAAVTLGLCVAALRHESFLLACVAMVIAGAGALAKQPAAFSAIGAGVALMLGRRWGIGRAVVLAILVACATALALVPELGTANARFFTLEMPAAQGIPLGFTVPRLIDDPVDHIPGVEVAPSESALPPDWNTWPGRILAGKITVYEPVATLRVPDEGVEGTRRLVERLRNRYRRAAAAAAAP